MLFNEVKSFNELFYDYNFSDAVNGRYIHRQTSWYPLLGLSGSIDLENHSILFCHVLPHVEQHVQSMCLNGVIDKFRIHRSARVNGPETMLLLASDLMREFEVCQMPLASEPEVASFLDRIKAVAA